MKKVKALGEEWTLVRKVGKTALIKQGNDERFISVKNIEVIKPAKKAPKKETKKRTVKKSDD